MNKEEKREYNRKYNEQNKHRLKEYKDKYRNEHKEHYKELRRRYYELHKEKENKLARNWYKNNKDGCNESHKKYRETLYGKIIFWKNGARKRNLEWSLTDEYIEELTKPMICYYTNELVTLETNKLNTISLDRIDSGKGYTKENVVVCQQIINKMKSNLSNEEFVTLCKKVVGNVK